MSESLNFFTVATGRHNIFIIPYIYFALLHNDNAVCEILTDNAHDFKTQNIFALDKLNRIFPYRFVIGNITNTHHAAHARFKLEPLRKCDYTYIGDIDVLILEAITDCHVENMRKLGTCLSNRLRGEVKLSGLQFVKTGEYYDLTRGARLKLDFPSDEQTLFQIVKQSGIDPFIFKDNIRPVHGFHISLNRPPVAEPGQCSWKLNPQEFVDRYRKVIAEKQWQDIYKTLSPEFKRLTGMISNVIDYVKVESVSSEMKNAYPGVFQLERSKARSLQKKRRCENCTSK